MITFIGRRLLSIVLVAVAIVFFVNLGMQMRRNSVVNTTNNIANHQWKIYTKAAWQSTTDYFNDAIKGDLGTVVNSRSSTPVKQVLADTYFKSMGLLLSALVVAVAIGLIAGTLAALSKRVPLALPLLFLTILGISIPSFFAALLLQIVEIQWVRTFGYPLVSVGGFAWDWEHLLLPTLVLAARPIAYLTRATFLGLNQIMNQDYIRTAWSKGLSLTGVVWWHALKNMAVPVLTAIGVSLRFALGSLPVVEFFFGWPGLGDRLLSAIRMGQTSLVVTLALALGLTFISINVLLDIAYRFIDPRLNE